MLSGNPINQPFRLLAIDPGTDTLGVSVWDVDLLTKSISLIHADTYKASQYLTYQEGLDRWESVEEKYIRLYIHHENMRRLLEFYQPHQVVHESAFMGRFPKAFQGLTECLVELRRAVFEHNPYLSFIGITPMEVKYAVSKGIGKDDVRNAMQKILSNIDLSVYDEHTVDSIAIGYTRIQAILMQFSGWELPSH
nr:MAG TPA: RuvC [Caudoviricetes sp.]